MVQGAVIALLSLLILAAAAALTSCRTCRQTYSAELVESAEAQDSMRDIRLRVDSVIVRDSTVTLIRGDTVFVDHWNRERLVSLRVDTVERIRYKTIYRTRTQTITVQSRASTWQKVKEYTVGAVIVLLSVLLIWQRHKILKNQ